MVVANALVYYDMTTIMAVKCLIVLASVAVARTFALSMDIKLQRHDIQQNDTQQNVLNINTKRHVFHCCAKFDSFYAIVLSVALTNADLLNVILMNVILLIVFLLNGKLQNDNLLDVILLFHSAGCPTIE